MLAAKAVMLTTTLNVQINMLQQMHNSAHLEILDIQLPLNLPQTIEMNSNNNLRASDN